MPETTLSWTLDSTAIEIIQRHPHMRAFFDEIDVDDCCLELDLRTIAAHHRYDAEELLANVRRALQP